MDIRRAKGLEVRKMLEDGNCLFRAVADQVYGDSETYDVVRQMCIDYMVPFLLYSIIFLENIQNALGESWTIFLLFFIFFAVL